MSVDLSPTLTAPSVLADDGRTARHLKLVHAAQQFEAVMMGELMKPLSTSGAIGGEDPDKAQSNAMQGFAVESMAGALGRSGALGFAKRIVAAVERHG